MRLNPKLLSQEIVEEQQDRYNGLPFAPLPLEVLNPTYLSSLLKREDINGITTIEMGKFESEESKELAEKAVIQLSLTEGSSFLQAWQVLGGENDIALVRYLEHKYNCELKNLEIAAKLFDFSYTLWKLSDKENSKEKDKEYVEAKIPKVLTLARSLSQYSIEATHQVASEDKINSIIDSNTLIASSPDKFEGSGVYVGLLGDYKNWTRLKDSKLFSFNISLGDTLPIITSRNDSEAMAVVLCSELEFQNDGKGDAEPKGLIQWYENHKYDNSDVEWQKRMMEQSLNSSVEVYDEDGGYKQNIFVVDTNEPPIVWSSLAKILKIRRLIPKKNFEKYFYTDGKTAFKKTDEQ